MEAKKIFVVSSSQTIEAACAISKAVAISNYQVTLKCDDDSVASKAAGIIDGSCDAEVGDRIRVTSDQEEARQADLVIESVFEQVDLKREVLKELDGICAPEVILATNTSTITVTELAGVTRQPDRVIGMHFIHFSPVLNVVEIARGVHTSSDTFKAAEGFASDIGFEVALAEDAPGLLSTRIWMVYLNEAVNNVFDKLVEPESLVKLNRTISPQAMSILESADFIGLDNCVARLRNLYHAYGDPKYSPSPLLTRMVDADQLGIKSGRGFFNYT